MELEEPRFANKGGWTKRVVVLGQLSPGREEALRNSSRQAHHAYVWTLDTLTYLIGHGIVTIPAPIYSLIYQELSNGMLGYMPMFALTPGWNIFCSNSNCSSYFF